jgi:thioredoxin reductase (NADPH)
VVIEGPLPGGQLTQTTEVDNYPGYPDGRSGPEMMEDLKKQAMRFKTDVRSGWVTKVDFTGPMHKVWVDEKTEIHARHGDHLPRVPARNGSGCPTRSACATSVVA